MKKYLLLLVFYLFAAQLYAQTKVVKGTLLSDSAAATGTRTPIANVTITEKDVPGSGTVTNMSAANTTLPSRAREYWFSIPSGIRQKKSL